MADWEKEHIVAAFSFELNQVLQVPAVQERVLNELLTNVADELAAKVGQRIGMTPKRPQPDRDHSRGRSAPPAKLAKGAR